MKGLPAMPAALFFLRAVLVEVLTGATGLDFDTNSPAHRLFALHHLG
jgi:hypothetical protein